MTRPADLSRRLALPRQRGRPIIVAMDLWAGALCSLGAAVLVDGYTNEPLGALLLLLAFYGVHRALRTGVSQALIAAPALVWTIANLWSFVPESLAYRIRSSSPMLERAPATLSAVALLASLLVMVATARTRLGGGVWILSLVALGLALFLRIVPSPSEAHSDITSSFSILFASTAKGWTVVGRAFGALCILLIGLGPIAVPPLPHRGGAIAGTIGAILASAVIVGLPQSQVHTYNGGALVVLGLLWLVANVLVAVGLGAIARAGAKPAGWIGVGLVALAILSAFPALMIFDNTKANAYAFFMAEPFALLGIGVTLLGWKGAPLETARKALAIAFLVAFAGGTLAWLSTFLGLARVTNSREPWNLAHLTAEPLATYGLILWAALLAYLAAPPSAPPRLQPQTQRPGG